MYDIEEPFSAVFIRVEFQYMILTALKVTFYFPECGVHIHFCNVSSQNQY